MPSATSSSDRQRACDEHAAEGAAFGQPAGDRVRQRHTHQEREAGLNRIVQRAAGPIDVRLVVGQEAPEAARREMPAPRARIGELRPSSAASPSRDKRPWRYCAAEVAGSGTAVGDFRAGSKMGLLALQYSPLPARRTHFCVPRQVSTRRPCALRQWANIGSGFGCFVRSGPPGLRPTPGRPFLR